MSEHPKKLVLKKALRKVFETQDRYLQGGVIIAGIAFLFAAFDLVRSGLKSRFARKPDPGIQPSAVCQEPRT